MLQLIYLLIIKIILLFTNINGESKIKSNKPISAPRVIPNNYFINPVNHPVKLAGTFCELRPNHFHTGIDIKSATGMEGDLIRAAADGFISRISIGPDGYGNALYIDHPNGYTTVYGHLREFTPTLEKYILAEQTKFQKFEVELYPPQGKFVVHQGDTIGKMGNTGASKGAHLHYEIRDTKTENPLNPLLFGLTVVDTEAPAINYVRSYNLDRDINESNAANILVKKRGAFWVPRTNDTILISSNTAGFGINTRDGMQGNWNRNGVYQINMYVDNILKYTVKMDSVSFYKTRMINAHLDYPEQINKNNYVHKCFTLPGNTLPIIEFAAENGVITVHPNKATKINFEVFDFNKNRSDMQFFIKKDTTRIPPKKQRFNYSLSFNKDNRLQNKEAEIFLPKNTLFRNTNIYFGPGAESSKRFYSGIQEIGSLEIPVFDYFDVWIVADFLPEYLRSKAFIGSYDKNFKINNWGGEWENTQNKPDINKGDRLHAKVKAMGNYFIAVDTIMPSITPIIYGANLSRARKIVFKIDDNILPKGQLPQLQYTAFIDNQWIRMKYDLKTKTINYEFPSNYPKGNHTFRLEVTDALNNTNTFSGNFIK